MKIIEIRAFFEGLALPKEKIRFSSGVVLLDVAKMVDSHLETLTANPNNKTFLPYYDRLMFVINHIKNKQTNQ